MRKIKLRRGWGVLRGCDFKEKAFRKGVTEKVTSEERLSERMSQTKSGGSTNA